jgi:autotransporter-associated beta strand protein
MSRMDKKGRRMSQDRGWTVAATLAAAGLFAGVTVQPAAAGWIGATGGGYSDYLNTGNWAGGVIDDSFAGVPFSANTFLYFLADHATISGGLNTTFGHTAGMTLFLEGSGGARTLTLNGDVLHQPTGASTGNLTFGSTAAANVLNLNLGGGTRTFYAGTNTVGRSIEIRNDISNGSLVKDGAGQLQLRGATTYTGSTTLYRGNTQLAASGAIANTSQIVLDARVAATSLEFMASGAFNRVSDTAPIDLRSGVGASSLIFRTEGSNVTATETIGGVTLQTGRSIIEAGNASTAFTNVSTTLTLASLARENRSVLFVKPRVNDTNSNTPSIGYTTGTPANYVVVSGTAPTTIGGNNSRGTNAAIVPYATSQNASVATGGSNMSLVTYVAGTGFRSLASSDYVPSSSLGSLNADGNDNLLINGSHSLSGSTTVNAVMAQSGSLTIGSGNTLTIKSGVIATNVNNPFGTPGASVAGTLDFNGNEGVITTGGVFEIRQTMTNANGVTVSTGASGNVQFAGINTYSGRTTVLGPGLTGGQPVGLVISYDNGSNTSLNTNVGLPDNGDVLIHPGSALTIGNTNAGRRTHEVVGSVSGAGAVRLGNITAATTLNRSALIIGNGGTGDAGVVTLAGGSINPGMIDSLKIGTLSITTDWNSGANIPLVLKSGTFNIDLGAQGISDLIAVAGSVTRVGTDPLNLILDDVGSFTINDGDKWRILTAGSAMDPALAFTSIDSSAISGGWIFNAYVGDSISGIANSGDNQAIWVVAVIPEPSALVLLAFGGLMGLRRRRSAV